MSSRQALRGGAVALGIVAVALFPLTVPGNVYLHTAGMLTLLLVVSASGWNVISGFAGYVSLGQSAFLGVGAYTVAIVALRTDVQPLLLAPLGGLAAVLLAGVLGLVAMRARGHAFVIITIAFLFLMQTIALNAGDLTGGSAGLTLPLPPFGRDVQALPFYYAMLALAVLAVALAAWVRRSKLGAGLLAIREDEGKAAVIGIRTPIYKLLGFVASAVLIGVAGGVQGYYLSFVDPRGMFDILVSVQIVLAALLGGRGTIWGPVLGAFLVQPLAEVVNSTVGDILGVRLVLYGALLGAVVMVLPKGVIPTVQEALERWRERRRSLAAELAAANVTAAPAPLAAQAPPPAASGPAGPVGPPPATVTERVADAPPQPRSRSLLELDGLAKRFGGLTALDGCSFEVAQGTITGLIGPNGSGKTTVFNLVSGTIPGDAGEVRFEGERIDSLPPWERPALGIGRTFQITRLFKQLTVLENVVAPLGRFSWRHLVADGSGGGEAARARELLDFVGLGAFAGRRAAALSFGQQKLVELAQVLMLEPRLILLDEPAGGVNPSLIERIAGLIRQLNREGITFLVVEHNMPLVLELCDPVVVLAAGRRIGQGPPQAIQRDPAVLEAYLGGDDGHPAGSPSASSTGSRSASGSQPLEV